MSNGKPTVAPAKKPEPKSDKTKSVKLTPEQKAAKFKKLATARGNRAIKVIGHIGNLSAGNYVSTPEQVKKLFDALRDAVDTAEARFSIKQKSEPTGIQL